MRRSSFTRSLPLLAALAAMLLLAGTVSAGSQPPGPGGPPQGPGSTQRPPGPPGKQQPGPMGLVQQVATMLCLKQAKSLGKDAFLQKYGETEPLAACRSQQQAAAQALVRSAVTACKQSVSTPAAMTACVKQKLMAALGNPTAASPTGGPAGGAPTQELVQKVAMALCLKEAKSLGKDAFLEKYGQTEPFAACRAQHQAAAQALVQAAVSACKESSTTPASFTACVMQRLQSVLGPPPSTTTHP